MGTIRLSTLPKTWVLDVDGTLVPHNGHLRPEGDSLLPGVKSFFEQISPSDVVILLTARSEEYRARLEFFLKHAGVRFDQLLCGMPAGERILINDKKPSGLVTAYAVNKVRDAALDITIEIDKTL